MSDDEKPAKTTLSTQVEFAIHEHNKGDRLEKRPPIDAFEARHNPREAAYHHDAAERLLNPPDGLVGEGSTETMPPIAAWPNKTNPRFFLLDTLEHPNLIHVDASETRSTMLLQAGNGCLSLGLDLAQTVQASNSVEKLVAHGMAVCHAQGMRIAARLENSLTRLPDLEQARFLGTMAKLFELVQNGALTIQKLKTGGTQRVEVQYHQQVNVADGGQAVVAGKLTKRTRRSREPLSGGAHAPRGDLSK